MVRICIVVYRIYVGNDFDKLGDCLIFLKNKILKYKNSYLKKKHGRSI